MTQYILCLEKQRTTLCTYVMMAGSVIYRDKVISKTPLDRLVCLEVANELEKNRDYKLLFSGERNAVVTTRRY